MRIFNILQHDSVETFKTLVFKRTHCAMQVLNGDGPESWPRSELVTQKAGPSGHRAIGPSGHGHDGCHFVNCFTFFS